ncbi:MAG: GNAT family N-acetyltransferase [Thermonemataceae bacterium]
MENIRLREGTPEDIPQLLSLIRELALYEKAPEEVINTEEQMIQDGFGEVRLFQLLVAETEEKLVGLALTYYRYSTWKGKCLYLEDLYIQPEYRRSGLGERFFEALVQRAKKENCQRISWQVLDWNELAINFYKKIGASLDATWINGTLEVQ